MLAALFLFAAIAPASEGNRNDLSQDDSRDVMQIFAQCMAKHYEEDAQTIVETSPVGEAAWDLHKLMRPNCMPKSPHRLAMRGKLTQYRYALAEALLLRSYPDSPPNGVTEAVALDHPMFSPGAPMPAEWPGDPAKWQEDVEASQGYAYVSSFGECVVRAAPDASWALLKTDVASRDEKARFDALIPAFSGCVAKGQQVELNKFNVRGSIALNYYRLAHAPRAVTAAAGASK